MAVSVLALNEFAMSAIAAQIGVDVQSSFCSINSDLNCTAVNSSSWALWLGIPVASYGLWFYLILLLTCFLFADKDRFYDDEVNDTIAFISFVGVSVSIALFLVSKFKVGVLCPICLGVYAVNIILLLVSLFGGSRKKNYLSAARDGLFTVLGLVIEGLSFQTRNRSSSIKLYGLAVLLGGILSYSLKDTLSLRYLSSFSSQPTWQEESVKAVNIDLSETQTRDYAKGPEGAALQLIEFADYECPACQVLYVVISELSEKYEGRVRFIYKNYPLDSSCNPALKDQMHPNGCYAAYLARCAGEQGKFWEMSDYLFRTGMEGGDTNPIQAKEKMVEGISKLGLDKSKIDLCVESDEVKNKVASDIAEGDKIGLVGTPTILINGKILRDISYDNLAKVFDQILGP